ncbi:ABC transporter ATP-binding protein [Oligoflexaceae bacterium]|nr:ABC transporter ATP-binding protein [Oligoflexaceae bacterium]
MSSSMDLNIQANGLQIDGRILVKAASITLPATGSCALIGRNGAGKSCLLRELIRRGQVSLQAKGGGVDRFSWLPQAGEFPADYTVRDFVLMGRFREHRGFPKAKDDEICGRWLDALKLTALSERKLEQLSGGERQLVMVTRALCSDSAVIVLDEPFSNLDLENRVLLFQVLETVARERCVIYSLHGLELLAWQSGIVLAIDSSLAIRRYSNVAEIDANDLKSIFNVEIEVDGKANRRFSLRPD